MAATMTAVCGIAAQEGKRTSWLRLAAMALGGSVADGVTATPGAVAKNAEQPGTNTAKVRAKPRSG